MRVLVCGYRKWRDAATIRARLAELPADTVILHGDNGNPERTTGADRIADRVAEELGLVLEKYPARWGAYGQTGVGDPAGPIRNREMLDTGVDLVLAFHDYLPGSKGTKDTVDEAERRGIPVEVLTSTPMARRT
jgi:hypothetical protein